jgi:hypothetical protein
LDEALVRDFAGGGFLAQLSNMHFATKPSWQAIVSEQ